jgi:23S rRNA (pseudouridine1915-N3)-methyltransferase
LFFNFINEHQTLAIGKPIIKLTLIDEYCKRLSFYIKFDLEIIADIKKREKFIGKPTERKKEGDLILSKLTPTDHLILLDENGTQFTSVGFSDYLRKMNS